jgi:hypothetical protein
MYCVFANSILLAPIADAGPYTATIDYWQRAFFTADIVSTNLLLPDEWFEVLDYMVFLRGHVALGEPDKAAAIQQLLYGFTNPNSKTYTPGLIQNLQLRRQANEMARDYGVQPRSVRQPHV